ncbi:MarR family transcriptional regulator [Devosia sp.]|uniref:MarR family winged helix-turn-helix transcriptional regulator n=1 Tax=Devosia sp. TaxID=1871048 RepID=UPI001AD58F5B|nr:MarR family transcriptional regulator [Devosia sp.]MBN9334734.1 MarR family transcriptional regulator [Devosia sp.]
MHEDIDVLIRDLSNEMSRGYRAFSAAAGLNLSDLMAISFIREQAGQATPTALGKHLGMTSGATAILINRLEKENFVLRERHPSDRRGTLLKAGPAAEDENVLPLTRSAQRLREAVLVNYSAADLDVIARFLADIVAALRDRNTRLEAELAEKTTKPA